MDRARVRDCDLLSLYRPDPRRPPAIESVALRRHLRCEHMTTPPKDIGRDLAQFYTTEELVELVRDNLQCANAFAPGPERDRHLQIVDSLGALFKDKAWPEERVKPTRPEREV
jgi:hypothetical protein